jgi:hypothetical protein
VAATFEDVSVAARATAKRIFRESFFILKQYHFSILIFQSNLLAMISSNAPYPEELLAGSASENRSAQYPESRSRRHRFDLPANYRSRNHARRSAAN